MRTETKICKVKFNKNNYSTFNVVYFSEHLKTTSTENYEIQQRINHCIFREIVNTCDKVNAHSNEAIDNKMDIDTTVPATHTLTIRDIPDATVDGQVYKTKITIA